MKKIKCYFNHLFHWALFLALLTGMWKLVRWWHTGFGAKTGHALDISLNIAAKKLEQAAISLKNGQKMAREKTWEKTLMKFSWKPKKRLKMRQILLSVH